MTGLTPLFLSFFLLSSLLLLGEGRAEDNFGLELYVDSQNGKEGCDGSFSCPFLTLNQARDHIRQIKTNSGLPSGGIAVNLREGYYHTLSPPPSPSPPPPSPSPTPTPAPLSTPPPSPSENFYYSPFVLYSEDSGEDWAPIVYRSYQDEKATVTGGYSVSPDQWVPIQGKEGMWGLDLVDIFGKDILGTFGELQGQGPYPYIPYCGNNKLELYYNDYPMTLARYPNIDGYNWQWNYIADVDSDDPNVFYYDSSLDSHISNWQKEPDLWVHGYWSRDYADSYDQVVYINSTSRMIYTDPDTPPAWGYGKGGRYYIVNAFSELDAEQEYYLDRQTGILYFIPPGGSPSHPSLLSFSSDVISMKRARYIQWRGVGIEGGREWGLRANRGEGLVVEGCVAKMNGGGGIMLEGEGFMNNSIVRNNEVYFIGCQGISVVCGDVKSLTPGNCSVYENNMHHYALWKRTYQPGLFFGGVGTVVANNEVSEAPHQGMTGHGNNLIFKNNYFHNLCYEVADAGAFYSGRNWIDWNNTLTGNLFEHIYANSTFPTTSYPNVVGAYFDDQLCGYTTHNNTFKNCKVGVLLGGGRQHLIEQNTFANNSINIFFDDRGLTWQYYNCRVGGRYNQQLDAMNYKNPPWSTAYPWLRTIFDADNYPCTPVWNNITKNNYCPCSTPIVDQTDQTLESWHSAEYDNHCSC